MVAAVFFVVFEESQGEVGVTQDAVERVVEFVCDAGGEFAHGGKPFGDGEATFHAGPGRDVVGQQNAADGFAAGRALQTVDDDLDHLLFVVTVGRGVDVDAAGQAGLHDVSDFRRPVLVGLFLRQFGEHLGDVGRFRQERVRHLVAIGDLHPPIEQHESALE